MRIGWTVVALLSVVGAISWYVLIRFIWLLIK